MSELTAHPGTLERLGERPIRYLLLRLLLEPEQASSLSEREWDVVIRQGRAAALLATLEERLRKAAVAEAVPRQVAQHLRSAQIVSRKQQQDVRQEIAMLDRLFSARGIRFAALKGAAYVLRALPPAQGRQFTDIDILVDKDCLPEVEGLLRDDGWFTTKQDGYYQEYYRRWMHQLPPMMHYQRQTVIDVHHALVPQTAPVRVPGTRLLERAEPLPGFSAAHVLSGSDMLLHSAVHLFNDGEFQHGLRDLLDMAGLLGHFSAAQPGFAGQLTARAQALRLTRPLYYAAHYLDVLLRVPAAAGLKQELSPHTPARTAMPLMDALFLRALLPEHPTAQDPLTPYARWLLYVRGHTMRMPAHLLLPHLMRKVWLGWRHE